MTILINTFLIYAFLGFMGPLGWAGYPHSTYKHQNKKPNILLITADDLGLQVGSYGDYIARTPNLDQLANEGIKFLNAYVTQASCSPSRSSMFTGLYPHQNGQVGLSHMGFSMIKDIPNIFSFFHSNGYRTGIIGKLHVQPEEDHPFDYRPNKHPRDVMRIAEEAQNFISKGNNPFLLSVNYADPHKELSLPGLFPNRVKGIPENLYQAKDVKAFDFQQINEQQQREQIADYYNAITRLDQGIGALLDVLEKERILQNTVVIFLSDHGPPFTRAKDFNYEASVHVPFIVRYPEKVKAGSISTSFISSIDIFPTLLDLTGFSPNLHFEGKSLLPVFADPDYHIRDYLFTEFTFHTPFMYFPRRAIRSARFKLIYNVRSEEADPILVTDRDKAYEYSQKPKYNGTKIQRAFNLLAHPPKFELYDLNNDPQEFNNIASKPEYQEIQAQLKRELFNWQKETHDPLLYPYIRKNVKSYKQSGK